MKALGIFLIVIGALLILTLIGVGIYGDYTYKKKISSHWNLADKSSTIADKAMHIDNFVEALSKENLKEEYNAIVFKTPNNSFDGNFDALKSLQKRLYEIKDMDVSSFEYQTAIQQITEQEQGGAEEMIGTLRGVWFKVNFPIVWMWNCIGLVILGFIFLVGGCVIYDSYR